MFFGQGLQNPMFGVPREALRLPLQTIFCIRCKPRAVSWRSPAWHGRQFVRLCLAVVRQARIGAKVRPMAAAAPVIDQPKARGQLHEARIVPQGRGQGKEKECGIGACHAAPGVISVRHGERIIGEAEDGQRLDGVRYHRIATRRRGEGRVPRLRDVRGLAGLFGHQIVSSWAIDRGSRRLARRFSSSPGRASRPSAAQISDSLRKLPQVLTSLGLRFNADGQVAGGRLELAGAALQPGILRSPVDLQIGRRRLLKIPAASWSRPVSARILPRKPLVCGQSGSPATPCRSSFSRPAQSVGGRSHDRAR